MDEVDDMIENPPVNPITGAHRTATDVRAELREHHAQIRRSSTGTQPIFLSDYLFFTVPGKGVRLGRVTAAPHGGALRAGDVVDIVEYEHIPQDGVSGLFGTFTPLANQSFDPKLKGSTKLIKHRDVKREHIVIYNVITTGRDKNLQVSLESLRQLADALPDAHKLPNKVPATHTTIDKTHSKRKSAGKGRSQAPSSIAHPPPVKPGDRIEVYWEEDPKGWFAGRVTSSRKEDDTWASRVVYAPCDQWGAHSAWHILDASHEDSVTWRFAK